MDDIQFVLASGSPRRSDLLRQIGISFKIIQPEMEEKMISGETPEQAVERLALGKAISVFESNRWDFVQTYLMIAADTIVATSSENAILGKPKDRADAIRMLQTIQDATHRVLTGYALIKISGQAIEKKICRSVMTRVKMRKLDVKQIEDYVQSGEPMDKAGAYAAQGIGMGLVEKLDGSYSNVVGLPLSHLIEDLENEFGYRVQLSKN